MILESRVRNRIIELQHRNAALDQKYEFYEEEGETGMLEGIEEEHGTNMDEIRILEWVLGR